MRTVERLMRRVRRSDGCWEWQGNLGIGGRYGSIKDEGRDRPVHRVAYEALVGVVPDGMELDHLCRNTRCVRPDHLEPVSHRENVRRGDGWAGVNARKSLCLRGHPLPEARGDERTCRECANLRNRQYRARLAGDQT